MKDGYGATTASENMAPKNMGVKVSIEQADNGVIVKACPHGDGAVEMGPGYDRDKTYVFASLDEALKEIPSIMSVEADDRRENKKEDIED